jgi:hypothetical protein
MSDFTIFPSVDRALEALGDRVKRIEIAFHTYQQLQGGYEVEGFQFCPRTIDMVDGHFRGVPVKINNDLKRGEFAVVIGGVS